MESAISEPPGSVLHVLSIAGACEALHHSRGLGGVSSVGGRARPRETVKYENRPEGLVSVSLAGRLLARRYTRGWGWPVLACAGPVP